MERRRQPGAAPGQPAQVRGVGASGGGERRAPAAAMEAGAGPHPTQHGFHAAATCELCLCGARTSLRWWPTALCYATPTQTSPLACTSCAPGATRERLGLLQELQLHGMAWHGMARQGTACRLPLVACDGMAWAWHAIPSEQYAATCHARSLVASHMLPLMLRLPAHALRRELLVQWSSRDAGQPAARYGSSPDALRFQVPASSASYGPHDMCGPPASTFGFVDPGVLHTATLSGLEPGRRYWYQVGDQVRPAALAGLRLRLGRRCEVAACIVAACHISALAWTASDVPGPAPRPAGRRQLEPSVLIPCASPGRPWRDCAHPGPGRPGCGRGGQQWGRGTQRCRQRWHGMGIWEPGAAGAAVGHPVTLSLHGGVLSWPNMPRGPLCRWTAASPRWSASQLQTWQR